MAILFLFMLTISKAFVMETHVMTKLYFLSERKNFEIILKLSIEINFLPFNEISIKYLST